MEIKKIRVDKLKAAQYNPRKNLKPGDTEYKMLKKSILEFGYVDPIIWNSRTGNVVGGHQRLKVLMETGVKEIQCVIVDLDKVKEKALNLALNKIGGEWDVPLLSQLLKDLEESGFNLEIAGFGKDELNAIFASQPYNITEDNFDAEESYNTIDVPITQIGDIWQLGENRLICGDCTDERIIAELMCGEKADLILTDPPYNVNYNNVDKYRAKVKGTKCSHTQMANDKMPDDRFYDFLFAFYTNAFASIKAGGVIYVFHAASESINFMQALKQAGFKYSQTLLWIKNQFVFGRCDYHYRHEPILYGWKEGAPHYFIEDRTQSTIYETDPLEFETMKKDEMKSLLKSIYNLQSTAIYANKPLKNLEHPTKKPLDLLAKLIHNSSRESELVFDPFGGSGSTLIAAAQLKRKCYTVELDPKYCDVIINRYRKFFGEDGVRLVVNVL